MAKSEPVRAFVAPLEKLGIAYAITGSIAAGLYGEPRFTLDLDLVVLLKTDQISALIDAFPEEDFYVPPRETLWAETQRELRGSFNLIHHADGFKADFYLAGRDSLHAWALQHRRRSEWTGFPVWVAPPEYVLLRKLEFFRESGQEKHQRDIQRILGQTSLDVAFLKTMLDRLGLWQTWRSCGGSELA